MSSERAQQSDTIFQAALDLKAEERTAYLHEACAGNEALRREVESLIEAYERAGSFIERPAVEVDAAVVAGGQSGSLVGRMIQHYRIVRLLGVGGMGEVYLATDTRLGRQVALKLLPAEFMRHKERLHRFEREALTASSLNHPNILTVYEVGAHDDIHFIATEYVEGESLRRRMARASVQLREALDVAVQIASALQAAHQAGIVHRDIKPENVMLRPDRIVKVLDLGLAKLADETASARRGEADTEAPTRALVNTAPGIVVGTPLYMSPEQARGLETDARTDIWSLGVVLYEMVAGRLPFQGETSADVLATILQREPPSLLLYREGVPEELERIVEKALTKEREERYQTAKDLGLDLKRLKRRLELDAELERSTRPEEEAQRGSHAGTEDDSRPAVTGATQAIAARKAGGDIHATSSAEYIATEIKRYKRGAVLVLATLLLAIAGFAYFFFVRNAKAPINSVAVLPFVNVTKDPNTEYLSDGISESLINNLSQLPQLKVIARSSSFKYKGKEVDPEEVARALGVQAIVTGRVVQRGDDLQISVELVNALDKTQMWGEQYNRRAADLQAVQAEIARTISEKMRLRLTGAQEQQLTKQATTNPQAYQLYLTGLFYQRKGNIEDIKKALDYFNQAVALDPNFTLAYARMTPSYLNLALFNVLDPKEALPKAEAAARRALELDESLDDAHSALAGVKQFKWDWWGAESEYKRAIELNPNLAAAHGNYAIYLSNMGRTTEALAEAKRAEELDPFNIYLYKGKMGEILISARRYDEAIQMLQDEIKLQDNSSAHGVLATAYAAKGMYAEAISEYQKNISTDGETTDTLYNLGYAYAMSGKRNEALAILNKLKTTKEYVSPAQLAILYVGLGDKEAAIQSLERAYTEHDLQMQYLKFDPHYDPLRSDPRFQDLMRRVGLPP